MGVRAILSNPLKSRKMMQLGGTVIAVSLSVANVALMQSLYGIGFEEPHSCWIKQNEGTIGEEFITNISILLVPILLRNLRQIKNRAQGTTLLQIVKPVHTRMRILVLMQINQILIESLFAFI
tara:strand:- start:105 stop:473 length:369 start_codon:yes stop_codon:yes gene_type:complete